MQWLILKMMALVRWPISHLLYYMARPFLRVDKPGYWGTCINTDVYTFSNLMAPIKYKLDPGWGVFDYTLYNLDLLFNNISIGFFYGNDCDDIAYAWYSWAKNKGYETWMFIVMDGTKLKRSHITTVVKINDFYHLCDYTFVDKSFTSIDECLDLFATTDRLEGGKFEKLGWTIYRHYKP